MWGVQRVVMGVLALAVAGAGCGCGVLRRQGKPSDDRFVEDMRHGRRPMGQVVMVEAERGFVLVRSPLASATEADRTLVVKAQGTGTTTGTLKVTPERKRNMVAADIVEGAPKVGEVVFFQTGEKVVSTVPPLVDPGGRESRALGTGPPIGGEGVDVGPFAEPVVGPTGELPPLGEPSGPLEFIPEFPGLDPLPEAGEDSTPPPPPPPPASSAEPLDPPS